MAEDNVKAQMRKGILEYCILAILSRGDSYAPRIIAELKAAEMIVVEAHALSDPHPPEKRRSAYLPLGRISSGASPQILHADRERPRSTPHARSSMDRDGTADRRDPSRRQTGRKPINRSPNERKDAPASRSRRTPHDGGCCLRRRATGHDYRRRRIAPKSHAKHPKPTQTYYTMKRHSFSSPRQPPVQSPFRPPLHATKPSKAAAKSSPRPATSDRSTPSKRAASPTSSSATTPQAA